MNMDSVGAEKFKLKPEVTLTLEAQKMFLLILNTIVSITDSDDDYGHILLFWNTVKLITLLMI